MAIEMLKTIKEPQRTGIGEAWPDKERIKVI